MRHIQGWEIFMKKRSIWRIAALVLCIAAAMGIVILKNRKETVTVTEKYHERDVEYGKGRNSIWF